MVIIQKKVLLIISRTFFVIQERIKASLNYKDLESSAKIALFLAN
jgi:hypothetical protein